MEAASPVGRTSPSTVGTQRRQPLFTGRWLHNIGSLCSAGLACVQDLGPVSQGVAARWHEWGSIHKQEPLPVTALEDMWLWKMVWRLRRLWCPPEQSTRKSGCPGWPFALLIEEATSCHSHANALSPEGPLGRCIPGPIFLEGNWGSQCVLVPIVL